MKLNLQLLKANEVIKELKNIPYQKVKESYLFDFEGMQHSINLDTLVFIRENEEYTFSLDIKNQKCKITLKKEKYDLNVLVEYATLLKNQNTIDLSYFIETDDKETRLLIELEGV